MQLKHKDVYSYHPETGVYLGIAKAWESPLEPGKYLIPACATEEMPPETDDTQQAIWTGSAWEARETPKPEPEEPELPTKEELLERIRQIRNSKLAECDWTQLPDAPLTGASVGAWQEYRQALRDIPQTIDIESIAALDDVVWPVAPGGDA